MATVATVKTVHLLRKQKEYETLPRGHKCQQSKHHPHPSLLNCCFKGPAIYFFSLYFKLEHTHRQICMRSEGRRTHPQQTCKLALQAKWMKHVENERTSLPSASRNTLLATSKQNITLALAYGYNFNPKYMLLIWLPGCWEDSTLQKKAKFNIFLDWTADKYYSSCFHSYLWCLEIKFYYLI